MKSAMTLQEARIIENFKTGDANTIGNIVPGKWLHYQVTGSSFNGSIERG